MPLHLGIVASSGGGANWTRRVLPSQTKISAAVYANLTGGKYYAFCQSVTSPQSFRSADGITWTAESQTITNVFAAGANSSTIVIMGPSAFTRTSTDGTSWTSRTATGSGTARTGIWDGTRFIFVGTDLTNNLMHSTTGATWTTIDVGPGLRDIAWNGSSTYLAIESASSSTYRICTANPTSAGNWTSSTLPTTAVWGTVAYGAGTWVIARPGSTSYATSTNGTTWTTRTLPDRLSPTTTTPVARIRFVDNNFVMWGEDLKALWTSGDGISWTQQIEAIDFTFDYQMTAAIGSGFGDTLVFGYDASADQTFNSYFTNGI